MFHSLYSPALSRETCSHILAALVSLSFPSAPSHSHTHALRHTGTHIDRVTWRINPLTIPVSSPLPPSFSLAVVPDARRRQSGCTHPTLLQPRRAGHTASGIAEVGSQATRRSPSHPAPHLSVSLCVCVCVRVLCGRKGISLSFVSLSQHLLAALRGITILRRELFLLPVSHCAP